MRRAIVVAIFFMFSKRGGGNPSPPGTDYEPNLAPLYNDGTMITSAKVSADLANACKVFLQDIEALPEEAINQKFGPKTRTIADIVCEVNLVNDDIVMNMRGEVPPPWPDGKWIVAPENLRTKAALTAAFTNSSDNLLAYVGSLSDSDLEGIVVTQRGEQTRFSRCQFLTLHLWYHWGQLNYVQTLLDDDEWHRG